MILILTSEAGDYSHIKIIDWLKYYGANFKIISGENILKGDSTFTIKEDNVFYDGINLTKEVTCVYFRRWFFGLPNSVFKDELLTKTINNSLSAEINEIKKYLFYNLSKATWIPSPNSVIVNKLEVLSRAKQCGFNVPNYIVTNNKKILVEFYKKNKEQIITKAIGNFRQVITNDNYYINPVYTKEVKTNLIDKLPARFTLSFFQQKIAKLMEYRIFYFYENIYPTAILSQENRLTEVDSRVNNEHIESRLVSVKLSLYMRKKIIKLMKTLNLTIGSIDMILSTNNKFFFLEVNPVGQIGGYSERCGYNIEQDVVKQLIKIDERYRN